MRRLQRSVLTLEAHHWCLRLACTRPTGAQDECHLEGANEQNPAAASHAAMRGARLPESEEWVVAIATTYDDNLESSLR